MKKQNIIILVAVIVIIIIALVIVWYYFKNKPVNQPQLNNQIQSPGQTTVTTTTTTQANDDFPLVKGSKGSNVQYLQKALNRLNPNNNLTIDGDFGNDTYTAVLLTPGLGTKYYPVTQTAWTDIMHKSNS